MTTLAASAIVTLALASDLRSTYIACAVVTGEKALAHPHVKDKTAHGVCQRAAVKLNSERLVPTGAKFWTGADVLSLVSAERTAADIAAIIQLRKDEVTGRATRNASAAARPTSPHAPTVLFGDAGVPASVDVVDVTADVVELVGNGGRRARKSA